MGSLDTAVISVACSDLTPAHWNEFCSRSTPPDLVEQWCRRRCRRQPLCLPQPGSPSGAEQRRPPQRRGTWPAPETRSFSLHPRRQFQIAPAAPVTPRALRRLVLVPEQLLARCGPLGSGRRAPGSHRQLTLPRAEPAPGPGAAPCGPPWASSPAGSRRQVHFTTGPHGGPRGAWHGPGCVPQVPPRRPAAHLTPAAASVRTALVSRRPHTPTCAQPAAEHACPASASALTGV